MLKQANLPNRQYHPNCLHHPKTTLRLRNIITQHTHYQLHKEIPRSLSPAPPNQTPIPQTRHRTYLGHTPSHRQPHRDSEAQETTHRPARAYLPFPSPPTPTQSEARSKRAPFASRSKNRKVRLRNRPTPTPTFYPQTPSGDDASTKVTVCSIPNRKCAGRKAEKTPQKKKTEG